MSVIAFPARHLTDSDEHAISAAASAGGYYRCRRIVGEDGAPAIMLLDEGGRVKGFVTKEHGVYAVLNARRFVVVKSRRLDEILSCLSK